MNKEEAKKILSAYRPGDQDQADPFFATALEQARQDPELGQWFSEEREFDRSVAGHLGSVPVPFGLRTRILANMEPRAFKKWRWVAALAGTATALLVISFWRGPTQDSGLLSDYQQEMMSFVKLQPPLEMESLTIGPIKRWLIEHKAPLTEIPPGIAAVETMGCRVLSFRGHPVTLICFCHGQTVAHLFIVARAALPTLKPRNPPILAGQGDWTIARWANNQYACMVAIHGSRAETQRYLPHG